MAKDKGWGSKTSSEKNQYKYLKDAVMNVQDFPKTDTKYSDHWKNAKKQKWLWLLKSQFILVVLAWVQITKKALVQF